MNKPSAVRVRYAPSPTGFQHIGNLHSALFNYLFARHAGGVFIVRLEDTDRERFVPEAEGHLFECLKWLDMMPDESPVTGGKYGPYVQSQRLELYHQYAQELVKTGQLYPCWCTPERLTKLRAEADKAKRAFKYDRHCLNHPGDLKKPHVLRFFIPDETKTVGWDDVVFGQVSFQTADLDDFVCLKSDGYPTYHFANVVDDHLMKISHVLRADEWLASTPKHLLLYQAFGWEPPRFIHLPPILGPDGKRKLSKRDGAKDVLEYGKEGYLVDALINFMALLGWNEGSGSTQEIYTRAELIKKFTPERIQKSPAVFDEERLIWMNGSYLRALSITKLSEFAEKFWPPEAKMAPAAYKQSILALIQERLKFLAEVPELTDFFFSDPSPKALVSYAKVDPSDQRKFVDKAIVALESTVFDHDHLEQTLRQLADDLGTKPGNLFSVLRVAITGKTAAPGLFETMAVLGKERVMTRLERVELATG